MKEFPLEITSFDKGLRKSDRDSRNREGCYELQNARVSEEGLDDGVSAVNPFDSSYFYTNNIPFDFPFPQLIVGKSKTFLCTRHSVYEVTRGTVGSWTASKLSIYEARSTSNLGSIQSGDQWQLIDFFDTWMLVNGNSTVFHIQDPNNLYGFSDKVLVDNSITIHAGVEHQGRAILGGFNPTNFWNNDWKNFWSSQMNENVSRGVTSMGLGTNFVLWTTIGASDLLWPFFHTLARDGIVSGSPYGDSEPLLFEYLKRGDAGFMPMSWQGTIYQIKPLGQHLVVYGSDGVSLLTPMVDPQPGYGERILSNIGVHSVGAVAGNDSIHMYVDKRGYLWKVSQEGYGRLGYKEFFSSMSSPIVANFNSNDTEFYFSDGETTYVYNKGLAKWWQRISSVCYDSGSVVGIFRDMNSIPSTYGYGAYGVSQYS